MWRGVNRLRIREELGIPESEGEMSVKEERKRWWSGGVNYKKRFEFGKSIEYDDIMILVPRALSTHKSMHIIHMCSVENTFCKFQSVTEGDGRELEMIQNDTVPFWDTEVVSKFLVGLAGLSSYHDFGRLVKPVQILFKS